MERAIGAVQGALAEATKEVTQLRESIVSRAAEIVEQGAALQEIEKTRGELDRKLKLYRTDIDARSVEVQVCVCVCVCVCVRQCIDARRPVALSFLFLVPCSFDVWQDVERSLRAELTTHKDLLERRVELQAEAVSAESSVRHAEAERSAMSSAYDRARREYKRQDDQHNELIAAKLAASSRVEEQRLRLVSLAADGIDAEREVRNFQFQLYPLCSAMIYALPRPLSCQVGSIKREMDLQIAAFLREEGLERKHKAAVEELQVLKSQVLQCERLDPPTHTHTHTHARARAHMHHPLRRPSVSLLRVIKTGGTLKKFLPEKLEAFPCVQKFGF
jgi:hypothetical protein